MKDDAFCLDPGQCPVQGYCARNLENWDTPPPVRIYERFKWQDVFTGCRGFSSVKQALQVAQAEMAADYVLKVNKRGIK